MRKKRTPVVPQEPTEMFLIAQELHQEKTINMMKVFDKLPQPLRDYVNHKRVEPIVVAAEYHKADRNIRKTLRKLERHLGPVDL